MRRMVRFGSGNINLRTNKTQFYGNNRKNYHHRRHKAIFERIIDKLEFEEIKEIEIADDFYWHTSADEWHRLSFEDVTPLLGSLDDDVASLKELINDPERPCTFVDFDRVGHILQEISQLLNPL